MRFLENLANLLKPVKVVCNRLNDIMIHLQSSNQYFKSNFLYNMNTCAS